MRLARHATAALSRSGTPLPGLSDGQGGTRLAKSWHTLNGLAYHSRMAHTERVTIGPQGRLVIPAAMRRHLGLEPGSVVLLRLEGDALRLERQEAALDRLRARYAKATGGPSVVDELLAERREEAHREAHA
jgi:AbrB family looped-hinge helix DNA binding protein